VVIVINTPWTPEHVAQLNATQNDPRFHPYTCGNDRRDEAHTAYQKEHGGDFGQLIATENGWICPACDYKQNWSH
jgi:hypothetical protein